MEPTKWAEAKNVAIKFSRELGFVNTAALKESELKGGLEVVGDFGFVNFHHRKDKQTTIYEIAVCQQEQRKGWGRLLFYRVLCSAIEKGCDRVVAKCPEDLASNSFYQRLGFSLVRVEQGKKRKLNVWRFSIQLPMLFYCGGGGSSRYDQIAKKCGWMLGIRSCGNYRAYKHMAMIDNHWKNYNHLRHLELIKQNKPLVATARDIEALEQLPEILAQAEELAQYCGRVLLIPKVKTLIPANYWLGYSVPSNYGGTNIECSWFGDRHVHLLGGSPNSQAQFAQHLNVVSLDGNFACNLARFGKSCWQGKANKGLILANSNYEAFEISVKKQKEYWHEEWRWEKEPLFKYANY